MPTVVKLGVSERKALSVWNASSTEPPEPVGPELADPVVVAGGVGTELIKLKEKDLTSGLEDPQAFNTLYFELRLNKRKGWQKKLIKHRKEQIFEICPRPDLPACDAYHWLPLWWKYLQEVIYRRQLRPDDYIFLAIGANGVSQVGEHVSHDNVQKWIKEFTTAAQLP
ncbi:hypothetical protein B0H13DRAFT_1851256 [Mycena leptocephala]|nr:hypothetical protein B0H13DRAFT_1851256 [Mycena leptocephala]